MTAHKQLFEKKSNKIAVITGASWTQGIGAAICRALAKDGVDIFFTYWSKYDQSMPWGIDLDEPRLLQEELLHRGVRCECLEVDLSVPDAYLTVLDEVNRKLGNPSILVNNACFSTNDGYMIVDSTSLDSHYAINVRATTMLSVEFGVCPPFLQRLRRQNHQPDFWSSKRSNARRDRLCSNQRRSRSTHTDTVCRGRPDWNHCECRQSWSH